MSNDCHVYLHRGSIRTLGKCNHDIPNIVRDNGIKMEIGECTLIITCSGSDKTLCLRRFRCPGLPTQINQHDWNEEHHFSFIDR